MIKVLNNNLYGKFSHVMRVDIWDCSDRHLELSPLTPHSL